MDQDREKMFKRIEYPETGLIDHASKIGVRLKSCSALSARKRSYSPRETSAFSAGGATGNRKQSAKALMSARAKSSMPRVSVSPSVPVEYIHNVVIPIGVHLDENSPRPATSFSGKSSLPKMNKRVSHSARTTLSSVSNNLKINPSPDFYGRSTGDSEASSIWGKSEQVLRYQQERENVDKGREMRKSSQVRSHRIDRMYYMCGTSLQIGNKYDVDEDEIRRLKDLVLARKNARINATLSASFPTPDHSEGPYSARVKLPRGTPQSNPGNDDVTKEEPAKNENGVEHPVNNDERGTKSQNNEEDHTLEGQSGRNVQGSHTGPETARTDETIACSEPPTERMMESSKQMAENLVFDDVTQQMPPGQSQPRTEASDQSETSLHYKEDDIHQSGATDEKDVKDLTETDVQKENIKNTQNLNDAASENSKNTENLESKSFHDTEPMEKPENVIFDDSNEI